MVFYRSLALLVALILGFMPLALADDSPTSTASAAEPSASCVMACCVNPAPTSSSSSAKVRAGCFLWARRDGIYHACHSLAAPSTPGMMTMIAGPSLQQRRVQLTGKSRLNGLRSKCWTVCVIANPSNVQHARWSFSNEELPGGFILLCPVWW